MTVFEVWCWYDNGRLGAKTVSALDEQAAAKAVVDADPDRIDDVSDVIPIGDEDTYRGVFASAPAPSSCPTSPTTHTPTG